jgi:hypothetical protein
LTRSKNGAAEMLDCVFTVAEGKFTKRKFFGNLVLSGTTDGHKEAADITRSKLRAILVSARGIKPQDVSEAAKKARVAEYRNFDGIRFIARIDIEKGRDGYKDKNVLGRIVTPDMKEWHSIEQIEQPLMHATVKTESGDALAIKKPEWAK